MRINTNISAIIANSHLKANDNLMSQSMERLSSGLKINKSADDSAGMAIGAKMRSQIKGLNRANQNASDGVSVAQTAEGALSEVHSMLQRMRELAVQGANDTYNDEDRAALQKEVSALQEEIERIAKDTEFNNKPLLDGSQDRRRYTDTEGVRATKVSDQVKAGVYGITIDAEGEQATSTIDINAADGDLMGEKGIITINGYDIHIAATDTVGDVKEKLMTAGEKLNMTVDFSIANEVTFTTFEYGADAFISVNCSSEALNSIFGFGLDVTTTQGKDIEASFTEDNGNRVGFNNTAVLTTNGNKVQVTDNSGFSMEYTVDPGITGDTEVEVMDIGTMTIHIGSNEGQVLDINIPKLSLESLDIDMLNLNTQYGCSKAITNLDTAIGTISEMRSSLGAYQNRLDTAVSTLSVVEENLTAAISRIEDVDMAAEMTEYTKYSILAQASTSVVAQANERPQTVLQLLQ